VLNRLNSGGFPGFATYTPGSGWDQVRGFSAVWEESGFKEQVERRKEKGRRRVRNFIGMNAFEQK
jgi:hypothetical protein